MVKLRSDFPKLNEDYYLTFLFSCLGFSVPTISLLLNKENYYWCDKNRVSLEVIK